MCARSPVDELHNVEHVCYCCYFDLFFCCPCFTWTQAKVPRWLFYESRVGRKINCVEKASRVQESSLLSLQFDTRKSAHLTTKLFLSVQTEKRGEKIVLTPPFDSPAVRSENKASQLLLLLLLLYFFSPPSLTVFISNLKGQFTQNWPICYSPPRCDHSAAAQRKRTFCGGKTHDMSRRVKLGKRQNADSLAVVTDEPNSLWELLSHRRGKNGRELPPTSAHGVGKLRL